MPYGVQRTEESGLKFVNLRMNLTGEDLVEPMPWDPAEGYKNNSRSESFQELHQYEVMKVFIKRRSFDRTSIGIRQNFKATISDGTYVDLKPNYKYWWDTNRGLVSLTYYLGNLDVDRLISESEALLEESKEVYLMYTQEGKKLLENMV